MRQTIEEYYEEAMKGRDHLSLPELCKRYPTLGKMVFEAELYEQLLERRYPAPAAEENNGESTKEEQPPTA